MMREMATFKKLVSLTAILIFISGTCILGDETALNREPLFEGLGSHTRKITTASADAQRYFDQGLAFLYAFNYDEAIRSFEQAARFDPRCAMAQWGIAMANGPHINYPIVDEAHAKAAWKALSRARELASGASKVEQSLIEAVSKRYAEVQPEDRKPLDEAYAAAMREVWKANPNDADVGALFVESLMDLRPWDLWTPDGKPQPGTEEIVATLESVMAMDPYHPMALHLYIHVVEASLHPEKADKAAERLRTLTPGLGHLVHMPSHIDVRRGRWTEAVTANQKAIEADRKYRALSPHQEFYGFYISHNFHMLAYAAMMQGRSKTAIQAVDEMIRVIPQDFLKEKSAFADGYIAMPFEFRMRFGKWDEILSQPEPSESFPIARALWHFARGVAFAVQGRFDEACTEQKALLDIKAAMPADAFFGNNAADKLLSVAEHMLAGEILFLSGEHEKGIEELEEAVRREDELRYDEPPDWVEPVRHALGAALLKTGRLAEAEQVYREDLKRVPLNGWSLFGLARSLRLQKKDAEAVEVEAQFARIWRDADVRLASSCFCQSEGDLAPKDKKQDLRGKTLFR